MKRNEAEVTTAVATGAAALSAADRCDRCGAQAYLKVELLSGGELLFCAHHAREHGDALKAVAANVIDESHRLADTPASAPAEEI
jgi:putative intracellular protease/amidase